MFAYLSLFFRNFFQIVECCHYFSRQSEFQSSQFNLLVTLLTGQRDISLAGDSRKEDLGKDYSPVGVAKNFGKFRISFINIIFYLIKTFFYLFIILSFLRNKFRAHRNISYKMEVINEKSWLKIMREKIDATRF